MELPGRQDWKVTLPLAVIHLGILLVAIYFPFSLSDSTNYWLFSTLSQSIAALFGFIFAGYAFFRSEVTLDDVEDPQADEIINRLNSKAHIRLANTSIPAAIAILGGLWTIALAEEASMPILGEIQNIQAYVGTFTFYEAVLAVILSILFVIYIVSPNRTQQIVEEILEEDSMAGRDVDIGQFTERYVQLENILRDIYESYGGKEERATAGRMIDYLASEDALDELTLNRLRAITRYRNLVVHGKIDSVDEGEFDRLEHIIENLRDLRDELSS